MASCDVFACIRDMAWPDSGERAAVKAEQLAAVYGSHVIETQQALTVAICTARSSLMCLQAAKSQGNAAAISRAKVGAGSAAARVRELRTRINNYVSVQTECERAVTDARDAQQFQATVGVLGAMQRNFRGLGKLADQAEDAMSQIGERVDGMGEIRSIMGKGKVEGATDEDLLRELEDLLTVEGGLTPVPYTSAPAAMGMPAAPTHAIKVPTLDQYRRLIDQE